MDKCTLKYCEQECICGEPSKENIITEKYGQIISGCKNTFGSVWYCSGLFYLYYTNFNHIFVAYSTDGIEWSESKYIALKDANADTALVFRDNNKWYLLYRKHSCWNKIPSHTINLATSDDGIEWFEYNRNPIMSPDLNDWDGEYMAKGLPTIFDPWGIIKIGDRYHLWFNSDNPKTCRTTGLAISGNLIKWDRYINNPRFSHGRFCVCPFKLNNYYYLIVTKNGYQRKITEFELYRSKTPYFIERDCLGTIMKCGKEGEFDERYIDTPSVLVKDIYGEPMLIDNKIYLYYTGEANPTGTWSHGLATIDVDLI